jgi:hypothetical protein
VTRAPTLILLRAHHAERIARVEEAAPLTSRSLVTRWIVASTSACWRSRRRNEYASCGESSHQSFS